MKNFTRIQLFTQATSISIYSLFISFIFITMNKIDYGQSHKIWYFVPLYILGLNISHFGSLAIDHFFNKTISWLVYVHKRLILQSFTTIVFTFFFAVGPYFLWFYYIGLSESILYFNVFMIISSTLLLAIFTGFYTIKNFFLLWEASRREIVQLKIEKLKSDYQLLQGQIHPHFLSNIFNELISEINQNPKQAVEFTKCLSKTYRYVFEALSKDVVRLEDEIAIIKSYLHIYHARVGDALQVDINVEPKALKKYLPPLTLQLLIENAIKHNVINSNNFLYIVIETVGEKKLLVKNNLNLKDRSAIGKGLSNLKKRYSLLGHSDIIVENDNSEFIVSVPLLENIITDEYGYESTNCRR